MAREAFVHVMNDLFEATAPESAVKQLMLSCTRKGDIRVQETMHKILGLKLYCSSYQVLAVSLDNSKQCTISSYNIQAEKLELEIYAGHSIFGHDFKDLNLIEFFKSYELISSKLVSIKNFTVIRITHIYPSKHSSW